jgi:hypothetical protein
MGHWDHHRDLTKIRLSWFRLVSILFQKLENEEQALGRCGLKAGRILAFFCFNYMLWISNLIIHYGVN